MFLNNGKLVLSSIKNKYDLEYELALLLNCQILESEDKSDHSFGADHISAIQIIIIENKLMQYWGKINWLSKPKDHQCFRSFQHPFYAEFTFKNNVIKILKFLFGDNEISDLDGDFWINSEINWMNDLV